MKPSVWIVLAAVAFSEYAGAQEIDDTISSSTSSTGAASTASIVCDGVVTCDSTYAPVCTSLGRTYANPCQFKNAYCESPSDAFYVVSGGPCSGDTLIQVQSLDEEVLAMPASVFDVPVELNDDSDAALAMKPATDEDCDGNIACDATYEPVCTTRGTFRNRCEFKNAYCERPSTRFYMVPCTDAMMIHVQSVDEQDRDGNGRRDGTREQKGGQGNGDEKDDDAHGEGSRISKEVFDVPIDIDDVTNPKIKDADDVESPVVDDEQLERGRSTNEPTVIVPEDPETPSVSDKESRHDENGRPVERDDVTNPKVKDADNVEQPVVDKMPSEGDSLTTNEPTTPVSEDPETPLVENSPQPAVETSPPTAIDCTDGSLACEGLDDPVCASNGFTYSNACQFKNAYCEAPSDAFFIVRKGPCDSADVPLQVQSISAEDHEIWGHVLNVPVELDDDHHHEVQHSSSACDDGHIQCSSDHTPVCASDGSTFRNECEFKNAFCENPQSGLHIVSRGECPPSIRTQSALDSTGVSADVLNAPVELDEVAVEADVHKDTHRSRTPKKPTSSPYCTLECPTGAVQVAPLCGTDSRSYINDCHLLSSKCEQPDLEKQYDGLCTIGQVPSLPTLGVTKGSVMLTTQEAASRPHCNAFCGRDYAPVCGSNGVTYANPCLFAFAHCQNPRVTQVGDGECATIHSASTPDPHQHKSSMVSCVPSVCPGTEAPVCGSDGQTYHNVCLLNNARCQLPALTVAHDGACGAETRLTCKTLTCPRYTECTQDPISQVAHCADVCHPDRCGPHETCKLLDAVCFTAPCSRVATCVADGNAYGEDY